MIDLSDFAAPRVIGRVPFRASNVGRHAHAPDGRHVAVVSAAGVELFDADGAPIAALSRVDLAPCLAFVDARRFVVGRNDGALLVLDVEALREVRKAGGEAALAVGEVLACASTRIGCVVASPDGALLAVACDAPWGKDQPREKRVFVLDAATLSLKLTLGGMRRQAHAMAFSPDGRRLAVSGDAAVRVYDLAAKKPAKPALSVGAADDEGVAWRGDALLTLGVTEGLRAWDVATGRGAAPRRDHVTARARAVRDARRRRGGGGRRRLRDDGRASLRRRALHRGGVSGVRPDVPLARPTRARSRRGGVGA
ncbi:MAG: hypothetical protein R3A52_15890 [Polyangiales bacterium]